MPIKAIHHIKKHQAFTEFFRFVIVGLINTSLNYAVFLVMLKIVQIYYIYAGACGFMAGAVTAYLLNRAWTFKSNVSLKKGFVLYILIQCFCLMMHVSIQYYVTEIFELKPEFSQFPSIIITMFFNFFLIRKFVFHQKIIGEII